MCIITCFHEAISIYLFIHLFSKTPKELADEIRRRIREEIGITVSAGVSFCKVFATDALSSLFCRGIIPISGSIIMQTSFPFVCISHKFKHYF